MIVDAANFSQNSLSNSPQKRPLITDANNRYYAGMTLKEAKIKDLEKVFGDVIFIILIKTVMEFFL